ncbi:hypothetical protein K439DRAFT_1274792, partial [Ramaria rubella]
SVCKLCNGGIIFEMDSTEFAIWINQPSISEQFLENFGTDSVVKPWAYPLIVEYVPLAFCLDSDLELTNEWSKGMVTNVCWIKPAARRSKDQRTAHIIMNLSSPNLANIAIQEGLIIMGKHVGARKLLQEPKQCLKCQEYTSSHIAANCQQIHDTCSTCSEMHQTAECQLSDSTKYRCTNCKVTGHAPWNRHCPQFLALSKWHQAKHPENAYQFFPSSKDQATW